MPWRSTDIKRAVSEPSEHDIVRSSGTINCLVSKKMLADKIKKRPVAAGRKLRKKVTKMIFLYYSKISEENQCMIIMTSLETKRIQKKNG